MDSAALSKEDSDLCWGFGVGVGGWVSSMFSAEMGCLEALEDVVDFPARRERIRQYNEMHKRSKKGLGISLLHRGESFGAAGQGIDTASGMVSI